MRKKYLYDSNYVIIFLEIMCKLFSVKIKTNKRQLSNLEILNTIR